MLLQRVHRELDTAMAILLYGSQYLGNFIPGHEKDPPVIAEENKIVILGPYSPATNDEPHGTLDFIQLGPMSQDKPGEIIGVDIHCFNTIDATLFHYKGYDGTYCGNSDGGDKHNFCVADNAVVTLVHMGFASGLLAEVQYKFSDGTDTGILGNAGHWQMGYFDLDTKKTFDNKYVLRSVNMQPGRGPSSTTGVAGVLPTYHNINLLK